MKRKGNVKFITKDTLFQKLNFPQDVCTGAINVSLTGNKEAWIENYKGILEYTDEKILLQGKHGMICLEGSHLSIDYYTDGDMKISGCISVLRYL